MKVVAAAVVALLLVAAVARADDYEVTDVGFRFELPEGFKQDLKVAPRIIGDFHDVAKMQGTPYHAGGLIFARAQPKTAVYALWRVSDPVGDQAAAVIRAEIDDFHTRPGAARVIATTEKVKDKVALARLEYKPLAETHVIAQALLFVDAKVRVHEVRLECLFPEELIAEMRPGCDQIFATFGAVTPEKDMLALGEVPPRARRPAAAASGTSGADGGLTLVTGTAQPPHPEAILVKADGDGTRLLTRLLLWGGIALVVLAVAITLGYRRRRAKP